MTDNAEAWRLLDANANRAAEGLRTIEDVARLVREDAASALWVKQLRHELSAVLQTVPRHQRLTARSTATDAGTALTTPAEATREDWGSVVSAAAERVTQSLRGLEEFFKVVSPAASQALKQLRYTAYDVLAKVELRLQVQPVLPHCQLYLLIDCVRPLEEFTSYIARLAEAGVDLFQLRDKSADGARLVAYGRAAAATLQETEARLVINDRVDVALACGAAGVHVGQDDLSIQDARSVAGGSLWIGVSTHDVAQAQAAESAGADYIGCGPTFSSNTKEFDLFPGTDFLRQAGEVIEIPLFAIGGIGPGNVEQVAASGCRRIAVSDAIHSAEDPAEAARALKTALLV